VTAARTLLCEIHAVFADVPLLDSDIFEDTDILSEHESQHYNLPTTPPTFTHLDTPSDSPPLISLLYHTLFVTPASPTESVVASSSTLSSVPSSITLSSTQYPSITPAMSVQPIIPMRREETNQCLSLIHSSRTNSATTSRILISRLHTLELQSMTQKKHACHYVDIDTADLWESIAEFADGNATYDAFVKAVHTLYPGSEEEHKWSVADMDKLVGEQSCLGILSLADLGEYFQQFYTITTFLQSKTCLSKSEQSRAFVHGFQPNLWASISQASAEATRPFPR
jgi:hypothetical protein